jgi:hypothetical protein
MSINKDFKLAKLWRKFIINSNSFYYKKNETSVSALNFNYFENSFHNIYIYIIYIIKQSLRGFFTVKETF